MALNKVLIALSCTLAFPIAALAQSPAWAMADTPTCCAVTTDGDTVAAAVLLPASMVLPDDARASTLAASVLLPQTSHAAHAMADMACCEPATRPGAAPAGGCCQEMKDGDCCQDGCDMPCCRSTPPER